MFAVDQDSAHVFRLLRSTGVAAASAVSVRSASGCLVAAIGLGPGAVLIDPAVAGVAELAVADLGDAGGGEMDGRAVREGRLRRVVGRAEVGRHLVVLGVVPQGAGGVLLPIRSPICDR
jgi:hypothetical protein